MQVHLVDGTYELFRYHYAPNNRDPERGAALGALERRHLADEPRRAPELAREPAARPRLRVLAAQLADAREVRVGHALSLRLLLAYRRRELAAHGRSGGAEEGRVTRGRVDRDWWTHDV